MMSHCFSLRAFFMAAAVSTRSYTGLYPPFFSSLISSSASSSESSTINTRRDWGLLILDFRLLGADGIFFAIINLFFENTVFAIAVIVLYHHCNLFLLHDFLKPECSLSPEIISDKHPRHLHHKGCPYSRKSLPTQDRFPVPADRDGGKRWPPRRRRRPESVPPGEYHLP